MLRRAALGLLVATALLLLAEGLARLVAGPPLVPVVVRMPDGRDGLFEQVDGRLQPRLDEHRAWWPAAAKVAGRPRVVFLGGSSLAAAPGARHKAAARIGEALGLEVVNLAVGGMDTVHLVAELPGVLSLDPDLVVVYSGHNDLGNALFTRRYADPRAVRIARTRRLLAHSRVYELLEQGWRRAEERDAIVFFEEHRGTLDAAARAQVLADYEERIDLVADRLARAGVPVVLSTMVSNAFYPSAQPSCPQELSALGLPLGRGELVAVRAVDPVALDAARAARPCWDLDHVAARLQWRHDRAAAAAALDELRDRDPTPVRATRASNAALAAVAARRGAVLADTTAAFKARGGGLEHPRWFVDQVHLSETGEVALAAALAPVVAAALGLPDPGLAWPEGPEFDAAGCLSPRCGS